MLGEVIGETKGKRIVRRVLSAKPMKVEVTMEDEGKMLGVSTNGFGTYTAEIHPDGTLYGEGEGGMFTDDGEMIVWKGSGLGKLKEKGAVSYRGILYFRTASKKLAKLNDAPGVFEFEVDAEGKTHTKTWEWK
jgi:hypothetical protein